MYEDDWDRGYLDWDYKVIDITTGDVVYTGGSKWKPYKDSIKAIVSRKTGIPISNLKVIMELI